MLVVNLFGSPGTGKSTGASYIFSQLKLQGYSCELITEFAKDLVYDKNDFVLMDQPYIFANQNHRLFRLNGVVDIVIVDSPLLLSIIYGENRYPLSFNQFVKETFLNYENFNFFLKRVKKYHLTGRHQTEAESDKISGDIKKLLDSSNIAYKSTTGNADGYNAIIDLIKEKIGNKNLC